MKIKKVDYNIANQRLDRYLRKYFKPYPEIKLSDIFSRIRKGSILINNKRVDGDYRLLLGDEIKFTNIKTGEKKPTVLVAPKIEKEKTLKLEDIKKMIIYEDDNWVVFNKPAGVVAHPSNKHENDLCMNDYLEQYCKLSGILEDETFKPSFGYRLDRDTSGVLVGAKNYEALQYLNEIIRDRDIDKEYFALVFGDAPQHAIIEKKLERFYSKKFGSSHMAVSETGQDAKTEIRNTKSKNNKYLGEVSLLKVKLYTGRMHQIRVHLSSENMPILGDLIYGNPSVNRKLYKQLKISRQMLHCSKYSFIDMDGETKIFEAPLPKEFEKVLS